MSPRKRSAARAKSGELVCPECGKTFTRPASLGAHRNRAHGVVGSSKSAASAAGKTATRRSKGSATRTSTTSASGARSKRAVSSRKTAATKRPTGASNAGLAGTRAQRSSSSGQLSTVNRDGLLQSLFPAGIPAREDAIRQVNAWLDEAERLARMR
jgi:uncharacterized C2H2 Zn-finger protein